MGRVRKVGRAVFDYSKEHVLFTAPPERLPVSHRSINPRGRMVGAAGDSICRDWVAGPAEGEGGEKSLKGEEESTHFHACDVAGLVRVERVIV